MNSTQTKTPPRYEFLDALRGYAILGVISYHCAYFAGWTSHGLEFANAGEYGVQLFFMVSAFTIFLTLERGLTTEPALVRSFYIRRAFRILPMFWVGILLYAFAPGREHYYTEWNMGFSYYALTALLQHGWHPNLINSVVPGGWTIAVEATFYLIAPLLFFQIKNWPSGLFFFLLTLLICVVANNALRIAVNHQLIFPQVQPQRFSYRWFPSQLPVFACGILTFLILKKVPETIRSKRNGLLMLAAAGILLYSVVGIGSHRLIPEHVFFAFAFLLLIIALAIYPPPLLVNSAVCFLGRISYSCYLMHFVIMLGVMPHLDFLSKLYYSGSLKAYALLFTATVLLTVLVSWITYKLIEQPFIRLGSSLASRLNSDSELELKKRLATI